LDTQQFDVVIMGGGVAGLSAGTRAAELGLRTVIVEKGAQPDYPCNSRYSGGIFHIAHRDPRTPAEELQEHIRSVTKNTADPDLSIALSMAGGDYIHWLQDKGVRFMQSQSSKKHSAPIAIPVRRLVGGLDWKGRGPDVLLRQLTQAFAARGGRLMLGTEGTRLVMREGRCCGLEVRSGNTSITLEAQAVVLADGGFQANLELVEQNIAPKPAQLIQRGAGNGNGAGANVARRLGARGRPVRANGADECGRRRRGRRGRAAAGHRRAARRTRVSSVRRTRAPRA
jgi:fumarate reductase flavoprotein subunit